jgi:4-alpha-glucanotransferase
VSSLPSPYGIGTFGKAAFEWIDFLHEAKQGYWQVLPLSPTGFGDSPYQSFSAFAKNPYFIDLDILCEEGLLLPSEFADIRWGRSDKQVDYATLYQYREGVLRKAFSRFTDAALLDDFATAHSWFDDYGLFMAIKNLQGQKSWQQWDEPLRLRDPGTLVGIRKELAEDIRYHAFVQYQFERQWRAVHEYANNKGVRIIGDVPIYVALDSADVWSSPELFQLDDNYAPTEIAGCPPDGFSAEGQVWGNPLYNWEAIAKTAFLWWIQRLESNFDLYDMVRIDHFRGLESYYAIPYGSKSAKDGQWKPGPGMLFVNAIKEALPYAHIIAEDLGFLTEGVQKLLKDSGYPGMKLIQFAFDSRASESDQPDSYEKNMVVYPGTHDNDTIRGWSKTAPRASVKSAMKYFGIWRKRLLPGKMIDLAMQCPADLIVIPLQDWLELGSEARMNTPSSTGGNNWRWRLEKKALTRELASHIAEKTVKNERNKGWQ